MACRRWNSGRADFMAFPALAKASSAGSTGSASGVESRRSASTASASFGAFSGSSTMTACLPDCHAVLCLLALPLLAQAWQTATPPVAACQAAGQIAGWDLLGAYAHSQE